MAADPFANLRMLDAAALAELTSADDIGACLSQPFDDVPVFGADDTEVDVSAGLSRDHSHIRAATRRLFVDYRSNPDALKHLDVIPSEGETLHGVISGKYAAWDMIPALIERTGNGIEELHIATLSYSKQNSAELLGLLDDGHIRRVSLIISYFFKAQNRPLYDTLVPPLRQRGHRVLAMRTHAKMALARMSDGTCYTIEGSANLRSCKNVEQFAMTRCSNLYAFHRGWMEDELLNTRDEGEPDADE